ncbi:MAG: hypothetical protein OEU32_11125, partial [Acidimicrobiia bacterium]|nr:hypothetical protein [Acidimicrobiia bacterium]
MKRRLIVLAGVIAALAAACGSSVPAIEIGDFSIDRGDLDQLIDDRLAELEEQGIPADNVATMDIVAEYLTEQGRIQLVVQAADEYGIDQPVSTIEDAALVFDEINVLLTAEGVDPATVDLSAVVQCSRHILVASLDEAQSVLDALADGEDFAALAASSSFD